MRHAAPNDSQPLQHDSDAPRRTLLTIDAALFSVLFFLPNMFMATSYLHHAPIDSGSWLAHFSRFVEGLNLNTLMLWAVANITLALLMLMLRRHVFHPVMHIVSCARCTLRHLDQSTETTPINAITSMHQLAHYMARMSEIARDYYIKHRDTSLALDQARSLIAQINSQQSVMLSTTQREMVTQYQSVLAYANYLEDQIARKAIDPELRYDFDEVSESSFNLKLIAGAFNLIQKKHIPEYANLSIPQLMQQTMLALAPSLDRRNMKLTTAEVDLHVIAWSDPTMIAHVLWMMLLGTIRYAADESTLRLRCLYNREKTKCMLSIVISELSPGRLSEDERGAFLVKQLQHLTPHMFAETIRIHGNIQLAQLLMAQLDGAINVLPLSNHSCEICLTLPATVAA